MKHEYEVVRSSRRTLAVEITRDGRVLVRAPGKMKQTDIDRFVSSHSEWIEKHLERIRHRDPIFAKESYTECEIAELKRKARRIIEPLVSDYQTLIGVTPTAVKINRAKGRFGSCSGKNSLNFSCFLVLYPIEAIEYVVVHELCHIKEHNHSPAFYREIERVMPDYKRRIRILKDAGYEE